MKKIKFCKNDYQFALDTKELRGKCLTNEQFIKVPTFNPHQGSIFIDVDDSCISGCDVKRTPTQYWWMFELKLFAL